MKQKKVAMTATKRRNCQLDAAAIAYYRRNPCAAAEDLIGVRLLDKIMSLL